MTCCVASVRFNYQYGGHNLADILIHKNHAIFHLNRTPSASQDTAVDEYEAAAKFGWTVYWNAPYAERVMMIAQMRGTNLLSQMQQYDAAEWAREEAQRNAK